MIDPGLIDPEILCALIDCEDDQGGDDDGPVIHLPNINPDLLCIALGNCEAEEDDSDGDPDFKLPDWVLEALGGLGGF
ncbi:MAG: hypothetical protein Kow0010_25460 [Dehalococcoidia bacterium]